MATERQTTANRANALSSTGPRTETGKAVSKRNALRHGLTAKDMLLDGEDPKLFEALCRDLYDEYQPEGPVNELMLESLAKTLWRLRRAPAFEAALLHWMRHDTEDYRIMPGSGPEPRGPERGECAADYERRVLGRALDAAMRNGDLFSKLSRYEGRLMRQVERALSLLRKPKSERPSAPSQRQQDRPALVPARSLDVERVG